MSKAKTVSMDSSLVEAIKEAYRFGQEDEELEPIVVVDSSRKPIGRIQRGGSVIFYDIRGEREILRKGMFITADYTNLSYF